MFLGALTLALVTFSAQKVSLDTRSDASLLGNTHPVASQITTIDPQECYIEGWAVDQDGANLSTQVQVYVDPDITSQAESRELQELDYLGTFTANRQSVAVVEQLQIGGNHGFWIDLSQVKSLKAQEQRLFLYAVELGSHGLTAVSGSPVTLRCV